MRDALIVALFALCVVAAGCATASTVQQPPAVDVTGTWSGTWQQGSNTGDITLELKQVNADVTGNVVVPGWAHFNGPLSGTVAGNELRYSTKAGYGAELTVDGDQMSGPSRSGSRLVLRKQR